MEKKQNPCSPIPTRTRHPAVRAWIYLMRIAYRTERESAAHAYAHGLTFAQLDVIFHIAKCPGITQQELAERMLVTPGNVTQLLQRMERQGLIKRVPEGRAKRLYLTEKGQEYCEQLLPKQEQLHIQQFAGLTLEEQEQLLHLLMKLDRAQRRKVRALREAGERLPWQDAASQAANA
ncbi:MarR family transcriptional regulator [Thermomicrobium sp. 4228-Ro]|uniref:MarR family winged helix-turn-helix transcriptional regulator n=1 Tax=Thermomicrobium sp. 4228-Ro TaxID=2993937 RepID=UPI002248F69F|nr:MarR family transcriptional regulator [Thermomicrobium sp. 4228-Ro]MCX2726551.1 MarR family transcriptional regulator [Thermomicrobium sp. 4228-Ro]